MKKTGLHINKWMGQEVSLTTVFVISLVVPMLFMIWKQREFLLQSGVLSESALSLVKTRSNSGSSLFLYVLRERLWMIPLLFLLSTTYLAVATVYGMVIWCGVSLGTLLAVAVLKYGVSGIFFLLLCAVPQYLFYVPALMIALRVCGTVRVADKRFFLQLGVLEGVMFLGCLAESYVNLLFVDKIIKIFIGV